MRDALLGLVGLVADGVDAGRDAVTDRGVRVALGNLLYGQASKWFSKDGQE